MITDNKNFRPRLIRVDIHTKDNSPISASKLSNLCEQLYEDFLQTWVVHSFLSKISLHLLAPII